MQPGTVFGFINMYRGAIKRFKFDSSDFDKLYEFSTEMVSLLFKEELRGHFIQS